MKITLSEQGTGFFLPKLEINGYNVSIDGRNILGQPIRNNIKHLKILEKIAAGQGDDYITSCLPDYPQKKKIIS